MVIAKTLRWATLVGLGAVTVLGCQKSSEDQRREADKAAAEAEKKAAEATNTEGDQKARDAREKAEKERDELHATIAREKSDYRVKINDAIDKDDKDLADLKIDTRQVKRGDRTQDRALFAKNRSAKEYDKIEATLMRRDRLMDLNDQIDKASDRDWTTVKGQIDKELKEKPEHRPGRI
jgi:hypothetical protein